MIRQALCDGAIRYVERGLQAKKETLISNLSRLLRALLPHVKDGNFDKFAERTVSDAVDLKTELSKEQAVYYCYLGSFGDPFNQATMHSIAGYIFSNAGDTQGKVRMCLFPGLARLAENEVNFVVVKAITVLDSSGSKKWM
jgi:hypothetical protein